MRVAQRVSDKIQGEIRLEMIMHDDPALQRRPKRAALFRHKVMRQRGCRSSMQPLGFAPLGFAADAEPGFIQIAHRRLDNQGGDMRRDRHQLFGFLLAPCDNAGRTQTPGAKQVLHDVADTILGNQLLRVQIDRRRLDAGPVLNMRRHLRRERCLRHAAATGAGIDVGVMLGHLQPPPGSRARGHGLRHIEHLPLLHPSRHPSCQGRLTMLATRHFVACDLVRLGDRAQRVARCPGCPPLFLPETPRRLPAIRGFLPKPSLDGGLLLLELFLPKLTPESGDFLLQRGILRPHLSKFSLKPFD